MGKPTNVTNANNSSFESMSYSDVLEQIKKLQELATEKRNAELAPELERIKEAMAKFGITPSDLGFNVKTTKSRGVVAPKYKNPVTGDTWTGRGLAPKWIREAEESGKNRSEFLIS